MRSSWLAVASLLLASAVLLGQQPPTTPPAPPAPAFDPVNNKLDETLARWEKAMGSITSLVAQCNRSTVDKTYQSTEVFEGSAKYLRTTTGNFASLEMHKKGRPEIFEKYMSSGTYLYEFAPQSKVIRVHDLPKPAPGQVADDNFLSFLFGMKALEAKKRYQLVFTPPPADDKWYLYVDIRPKDKADMVDFTRARLVLTASTYLPRQLWFEQPNGNEVTWDFPQMMPNANLAVTEFAAPQPPAGWQYERTQPKAQPRIFRNQQ